MAQRLVRKLCEVCKQASAPTEAELKELGVPASAAPVLYSPQGCMSCGHSGFEGRLGVYELLVVNKEISELLHANATESEIEAVAFAEHDMLFDNARRYVLSGQTSLSEVLRVCRKEVRDGGI